MTPTTFTMLVRIKRLVHVLIFLFTISLPGLLQAQQTNNWYFGSPAGFPNTGLRVDFTSGTPVVSTGIPMLTEEGSSSISDASGNPLFYTDGVAIWDASTNTTFGTGMNGGSSSTQSAVVMPKPGTTNQWLVFTSGNNGSPGLSYYTVTGTGSPGVSPFTLSAATNLVGAGAAGEGMSIIGSTKAGSSFWVIVRDAGSTGVVRAFDVSNAGVVNATAVTSTLSNTGFTNTSYTSTIGSIKSNTCQNKLAFTYLNADVDITDFDAATGQVVANTAKRINVVSTGGNSGSYGIEFSTNDAYLYITNLSSGNLYRYDVAANTVASFGGGIAAGNEAGQLQAAPDGKIYMANRNASPDTAPNYLASITNPGAVGATFTAQALLLSGVTSGGNFGFVYRGLPTFPKSLVVSSLNVYPGDGSYCTSTSIPLSFSFGGAINAATISWTATGGGQTFTPGGLSSTNASPSVSFSTAGTKVVTLAFDDLCGRHYTNSMTFQISLPKTPVGTISCAAPYDLILQNTTSDPDAPNYIWYNGSVSPSNVIGIGSPYTYRVGTTSAIPSTICLGVASSASSTGGSNSIATALAMGGAANGAPYTSNAITVLSDVLILKSFDIKFWTCPTTTYTVAITNTGGTTVYSQSNTIAGCASGTVYTVIVNTTLPKGGSPYTITLSGAGAQFYRGTWGGATNAGQVTYGPETFSGTTSIANIQYDYKNFTITTTCSSNPCYSPACTLPVTLIDFTGLSSDQGVKLYWSTASEINNSYFQVEHSTDGIHFVAIGEVKGAGNSNSRRDYSLYDANASKGINYYRLVQYDFDGTATYSKVISVEQGVGSSDVIVYPNPSTNNFTLSFTKDFVQASVVVNDILGRVLLSKELTSAGDTVQFGEDFPKGVYLVQFNDGKTTVVKRIVKE